MLQTREGSRYLFGKISEGAQRTLNENGMRLSKLRLVFLSGTVLTWAEIGGLPGLFLTASDATSRDLDVYTNSSKILAYVVSTWRYFVFRKGIELHVSEPTHEEVIGDASTVVFPVKIHPRTNGSTDTGSPDSGSTDPSVHRQLQKIVSLMFPRDTSKVNSDHPDSYKWDPSESEAHTHTKLPDPAEAFPVNVQPSMNYVIRFLPVRGKFDPKKAIALGVKPGTNFRDLTNGVPVFSECSNLWVNPDDVMGPPKEFKKVVILDIPNKEYLLPTLESERWFAKSDDLGHEDPGIVYHFLGKLVDFSLPIYQDFLKKFPNDCHHVISHPDLSTDTLVFKTAALHNLKLKVFLNDNFCLPHIEQPQLEIAENVTKLHLLQCFTVVPEGVTCDNSRVSSVTWDDLYTREVPPDSQHLKQAVLQKSQLSLAPLEDGQNLKDHVQIVTLGTGSALPSIHRNVLSNLVRIPYLEGGEIKFRAILLDGGENTMGMLTRNFGHNNGQQLVQILHELELIYLSHLHADHHLGLISVVNEWIKQNRQFQGKKLHIVAPWQYHHFVEEWMRLEKACEGVSKSDLDKLVFISCEDFATFRETPFSQMTLDEFEEKYDNQRLSEKVCREKLAPLDQEKLDGFFDACGIVSVETVRAIHCYWAYSVSFVFKLGNNETFKISYSGDTRPNVNFAKCGANSDLLIHEASLDDDLIEEALAKKHSTLTEAVKMAQLMNCPKIVLTHFSTRFSEKQSFIRDGKSYQNRCNHLRQYLGKVHENIMMQSFENERDFSLIDICYAYDLMSIRYKHLDCQKAYYDEIEKLSAQPESETELEKQRKEKNKQQQKREAKRMQRMQIKKKRLNE